MAKRKPDKIYTDRMLTGEREESNPYLTAALYFLVVLMSCMLVMVVFVSMCRVDGDSMLNSHQNKDHVLLYKFPREFSTGDVVVFDVDEGDGRGPVRLIKRVVGVAGDEILFVKRIVYPTEGDAEEIVDLYRRSEGQEDFVLVEESYINGPMLASKIGVAKFQGKIAPSITDENKEKYKITVDEGFLLVLGDNRNNSRDSRYFGQIPTSYVVGKEIFHFTQGSLLEKIMLIIFNSGFKGE